VSEHKKNKPKIEDFIKELFDGTAKENALDFATWLSENKLNPIQTSKSGFKLSRRGCVLCYIRFDLDVGILRITPYINEYDKDALSDEFKEIVWANKTNGCLICHVIAGDGYNCSYKLNTIFGKHYEDACMGIIVFENPSAVEFECIKKLLVMKMNTIKNGRLLPNAPTNYV